MGRPSAHETIQTVFFRLSNFVLWCFQLTLTTKMGKSICCDLPSYLKMPKLSAACKIVLCPSGESSNMFPVFKLTCMTVANSDKPRSSIAGPPATDLANHANVIIPFWIDNTKLCLFSKRGRDRHLNGVLMFALICSLSAPAPSQWRGQQRNISEYSTFLTFSPAPKDRWW